MKPPRPNCGHADGKTFTWISLAGLWMCQLCIASIGGLYRACARCGLPPARQDMLVVVHGRGALCFSCRRDFVSGRRSISNG